MRADHSHHFHLKPDFMARAAGNDGNLASKEKNLDSHYGKSEAEIILGYKRNIAILREFIHKEVGNTYCKNLDSFVDSVESGIQGNFTPDILASYKTLVFDDLSLVCSLTLDADLPEDVRIETIKELTAHLDVCAPGMAQHIEEAARKLQVLKNGLPQNFINQLINVITAEIADYISKNNICPYIGDEIHYIAAFFNHIAPSFGLPPRVDPFAPRMTENNLDQFTVYIHDKIIIDRVIEVMAEDCRNQIVEAYAKDHPNLQSAPMDIEEYGEVNIKFNNVVQPKIALAFGPILSSDIFNLYYENREDEDEKYKLAIDNTLLINSIAANLRAVGTITFDSDYLAGEKGPGAKLKISGEKTVYVSTTDNSKQHHHQILEEFVWHDDLQAKMLLNQLDAKAAERPEVKNIQEDILQRISLSAAKRMLQAADLKEVKNILDESVALLWSDTAQEQLLATSLEQALRGGKPEIAEIVLSLMSEQRLGDQDGNGNTALHLAVMNEYFTVAHALVERMSIEQLSRKNKLGMDCASMAREKGLDELSGTITSEIERKKDIAIKQRQLWEELRQSLNSEDPQEAEKFIKQILPSTLGMADTNGDIALMLAMYSDRKDICASVIPLMSQLHFGIQNKEGHTALMTAIEQLYPEFTESISSKMTPQQLGLQNSNGDTALMLALKMDDSQSIEILLARTSQDQLGIRNIDGDTPLMLALKHNNFEIATLLADRMSQQQLDIRNNANHTALSMAFSTNQASLIDAIASKMDDKSLLVRHQRLVKKLQEKLDNFYFTGLETIRQMLVQHLDVKNSKGDTPLMMALKTDHDAASLALIAKMTPAQLGVTDRFGNTALMLALHSGKTVIAKALMEKMPAEQLEIANTFGTTAFTLAKSRKQREICRHIVKKINPPSPGFFTRIQLFFMNMVSEKHQSDATRAKLAKFYWY